MIVKNNDNNKRHTEMLFWTSKITTIGTDEQATHFLLIDFVLQFSFLFI